MSTVGGVVSVSVGDSHEISINMIIMMTLRNFNNFINHHTPVHDQLKILEYSLGMEDKENCFVL